VAEEMRLMWVDPGGGVITSVIDPGRVFRTEVSGSQLRDNEQLLAFVHTLDPEEPIVLEVTDPEGLDLTALKDLAREHGRDVLVVQGVGAVV
jgi:hypothetical protein